MKKYKRPWAEQTFFESRADAKRYCRDTANKNWIFTNNLEDALRNMRDDSVRDGNAKYFTSSELSTLSRQLDEAIKKTNELSEILGLITDTRAWESDEMNENEVHGYKMFDKNWTCHVSGNMKKYSCPGRFREFGEIEVCGHGMHFCKNLEDCLAFYKLGAGRIAEVVAHGEVKTQGSKSCTNDLEIVREIDVSEAIKILNFGGIWCTGIRNSGHYNVGNDNYGNLNVGSENYGTKNTGCMNFGNCNTGHKNIGNYNVGGGNIGNSNIGDENYGSRNVGNRNKGNFNTGSWNAASFTTGFFMTKCDETVKMFNEESTWSRMDFINSKANAILKSMPITEVRYSDEKPGSCYAQKTGRSFEEKNGSFVYEKIVEISKKQKWWDSLSNEQCMEIFNLPNFDPEIFKECTDIDVRKQYRRLVLAPRLQTIFGKLSSHDAFSQFVLSEWNDEIGW